VAANVTVNTTMLSGPNYTTSRDVTQLFARRVSLEEVWWRSLAMR
jgi:hypothetical protein